MASLMPGQKSVLITGCSPGGIGHALALEFHAKGLFVIATARRLEVLGELADKGLATIQLDVTDEASIATCRQEVDAITSGRLDILINNAGRPCISPATDLDLDEVRDVFETNVFGVMAMCKAFVRLLIKARGLIVNIASLSAVSTLVFSSAYAATKGALIAYSRTLRQELLPLGVRVTVAMVGNVQSNIYNAAVRTLPADSLYMPVADVYAWRQTFSQTNHPMATPVFARSLVRSALRAEMPLPFRDWFGRPDWFWGGGMSRVVYIGTCLGEWLGDMAAFYVFRLKKLKDIYDQSQAKPKSA